MSRRFTAVIVSALVALGLFGPMVGLKTEIGPTTLYLDYRPRTVLVMVAAVAFFFLVRALFGGMRLRRQRVAPSTPGTKVAGRVLTGVLLVAALALPFSGSRQYIDIGILIMTYVMLGWGLNIVVGLAGLLDLGYVAFYAIGAYSYALFAQAFGLGFWTCLPIAGLLAALAGVLLAFPILRLRGDYLAIVTLGFGEIIRIVIVNWTSLTGGPNGLLDIPRPTLFGLTFSSGGTFAPAFGLDPSPTYRVAYFYFIILALALLTNWVTLRLRRVALGRAWEALREDEIACRALGINVTVTKLTAFAIGAGFGGLAGAFFATRASAISPESFVFMESATVLAIVVLGGLGSQLGIVLAAILMIGGSELLRNGLSDLGHTNGLEWLAEAAGGVDQYRMLLFGLAMVAMMIFRPRGLVSGRTPTVALGARREIAAELVAEGHG